MLKVISGYYISRLFRLPVVWGKPLTLSIEPTTACNLRCPECPSGLRSFSRLLGNLASSNYTAWLSEVKKHVTWHLHLGVA
jgi:hypothetical protein